MFNRNQKSRKKAKPLNPSNTLENSQNRYQGPPIRLEDIYTPSALIPVDDGDLSSQELEFNIDPSFDFAEDSDWEAPIPVEENYQENSDAIASNDAESESDGVTPLIETAEPIYLPDEEVEEFPFISSEALEIEGETAIASPISSDESFVDLPTDDIAESSVTTDETVPDSTVNAELNVTQKTETESTPEEIDTLLANDPHDDFDPEQEIRRLAQSDAEFSENFITDDAINNGENPENQPISTHDIKITASELSQDSDGGENLENSPTIDNDSIEYSETSPPPIELNNPVPQFDIGTFKVDNSGEVGIDFLFDGGGYKGELAIISLEGMEQFEPGSEAFIQEAASRALSNSEFGHIVISDRAEGARFNAPLGEANHNQGAYLGVKTFAMRPGDTFGVMLVPNGTVQQVFNNPAVGGALRPLFSMATANPLDTYNVGQIADVSGDGNTFVMEDLRIDQWTDRDYNDLVFQVRGATGTAPVMDEVVAAAKDWRGTDMGRALIEYAKAYITPKEVPFDIDSALSQIITDLDQLLDEFDQQPEQPDADADTSNTKPDSTYGDGDFIVHETDDRKTNGEAESNPLDTSNIPEDPLTDPTDPTINPTLAQNTEIIFEPGEETFDESDLGEESKISSNAIATSPDPETPPIDPVAQLGEQETSEPEIPPIDPVAQLGEQETPEPEIPPINAVAKVGEIETSDPEVPPIEPVDKTPLVEPGTDAIASPEDSSIEPEKTVAQTSVVEGEKEAIAPPEDSSIEPGKTVAQTSIVEGEKEAIAPPEDSSIEPEKTVAQTSVVQGEKDAIAPPEDSSIEPGKTVAQTSVVEGEKEAIAPSEDSSIDPETTIPPTSVVAGEKDAIAPSEKPSIDPETTIPPTSVVAGEKEAITPPEDSSIEPEKTVAQTSVVAGEKEAITPTLPTVNSDSEIIKSTISQPSTSVDPLPTTEQTVYQSPSVQTLPDQGVVKVVDSQPVVTPEINNIGNQVDEPNVKPVTVSESATLGTADTRTDFARFTTSVSTDSNTAESGSTGNQTPQVLTFDSPETDLSKDPGSIKENLIYRLKNLGETLKTQNTETQTIPGQSINPQLIANLEKVTTKLQNSAPSAQLNQIAETFIAKLENTVVRSSPPAIEPVVTAQYQFPKQEQPIIGIIDTGFAENNIDIDYTRITLGRDRISGDNNPLLTPGEGNEHGTHILGIIGATQNNGIGIDGINDQAPIWLGRAVGSGQWAETLVEFVDAAKESGQPNAVVNLSFDLTQVNPDGTETTRYELTAQERAALAYAQQNQVLIVVGAGNEGGQMSALGQASLEFDNIITVGSAKRANDAVALSKAFERADYSSYGYGLDIIADGGMPWDPQFSTVGDDIGAMVGTSVSAAKVTGAASQVWAANPDLSYQQVIDILKRTATDLSTANWDAETGMGLLNIAAAVSYAKATEAKPYISKGFDQLQQWLWNAQIPQVFWPGFYRVYYYFDAQSKINGKVWNPVGDAWASERPVWGLGDLWNTVTETASNTWNAVTETASNTWNAVTETASNTWNTVTETASNTWNTVTETVSNTWNAATSWAGDTWNAATSWAGDTWNAATSWAGDTWNAATSWAGDAWDTASSWVAPVIDPIVEFVNQAYTDINAGIEYLLDGTLALGSAAYNQVVNFVSDTWSDVTDLAAGAWGAASDWMTDSVDNIISWAGDSWDGVVDWVSNAWDTAENWFSDASSWASGVWDSAGSAVNQIQNAASNWWNETSSFAGNFLSDQGQALSDWWNSTAPDWGSLTGQGKELFQGITKNIGTAVGGFADNLGAMLPDSLGLMIANPALALVTNPIETVRTATNLYNTFKAVAANPDLLWDAVGTPDQWWNATTNWVGDAWNQTTKTLGDAWNTSSKWVSDNYNTISDWGHGILDAAGFVPGLGAVPDLLNAVWYAAEGVAGKEGAWANAAWSAAAAVPLAGDAAAAISKGGKYINKFGKVAKAADKVTDVAKGIDKGTDLTKVLNKSDDVLLLPAPAQVLMLPGKVAGSGVDAVLKSVEDLKKGLGGNVGDAVKEAWKNILNNTPLDKKAAEVIGELFATGIGGVVSGKFDKELKKAITDATTQALIKLNLYGKNADEVAAAIGAISGYTTGRIVDGTIGYVSDQFFGNNGNETNLSNFIGGGISGQKSSQVVKDIEQKTGQEPNTSIQVLVKGFDAYMADQIKKEIGETETETQSAYQWGEDSFSQWTIDFETSLINWAYPNSELSQIYQTP